MENRNEKIDKVLDLLKGSRKENQMKIFIFKGKGKEAQYYKSIPWTENIDVTVMAEASADSLIEFLTILKRQASNNPIITGFQIVKDE